MMKANKAQFALFAAAALALAACGSSGEGDSDSTAAPSEATSAPAAETTSPPAAETTSAPAADTTSAPAAAEAVKVGFLLSENQTVRYEKFDRPVFEEQLAAGCPQCELLYANAENDAALQQTQAESMIAQGIEYLVLNPVDGAAAAAIVSAAKDAGVTVIGYDRNPDGPVDYTVSFSLNQLGQINGQALAAALEANGQSDGQLVFILGDETTAAVPFVREGAVEALGTPNIAREFNIKNWDPAEAQLAMDQAITALGAENIAGVYAMNDGMAGGVIAALKSAGVTEFPPITGMDAEVSALQRILVGEQLTSLYNSPSNIATAAAAVVSELVAGGTPATTGTLANNVGEIPLILPPDPISITISNMKAELIDTGVYTAAEICTADFADACAEAGIS